MNRTRNPVFNAAAHAIVCLILLLSTVQAKRHHSQTKTTSSSPPNCSEITVSSDGATYKAPQLEGGVFLPDDIHKSLELSKYKAPPLESVVPVETLAITSATTTSQTKDAGSYTTEKPCPAVSTGRQYNWWQILLDHGGKPGAFKGIPSPAPTNNASQSDPHFPCQRPLEIDDNQAYVYEFRDTDFRKYFREETVYRRFAGAPEEFFDVRGTFVWIPSEDAKDTRGYHINYILDDTAFWVKVLAEDCRFQESDKALTCPDLPDCTCVDGELDCGVGILSVSPNLLASLVGAG